MHPDIATDYAQQIIRDRHRRASRARFVRGVTGTSPGARPSGPRPARRLRMRLTIGTFAARPRRVP